jgi:DNA gyrase subunit A
MRTAATLILASFLAPAVPAPAQESTPASYRVDFNIRDGSDSSAKAGRRYIKLNDGDKVVQVTVPQNEETIYLASANGHVLQFAIDQINILAGVGKGVIGIKLAEGDTCLGGALMGGRFDKFTLETSGGKLMEFGRNKYEPTSRGGKGFEAVKRANFARVVPPPIELVNWDEIEGKVNGKPKEPQKNGEQPTLFEE